MDHTRWTSVEHRRHLNENEVAHYGLGSQFVFRFASIPPLGVDDDEGDSKK